MLFFLPAWDVFLSQSQGQTTSKGDSYQIISSAKVRKNLDSPSRGSNVGCLRYTDRISMKQPV